MKLLGTIYPHDVDPSVEEQDYAAYELRPACRAIVFDDKKVALLHVSAHGYYMLPGGGMDNDDLAAALAREIQEELGCTALVAQEVGSTEVYFDRWRQKQIDYCFITRKDSGDGARERTEFEVNEGHETVWAPSLAAAIELVEQATPDNRDGKLVRARELLFLHEAAQILGESHSQ